MCDVYFGLDSYRKEQEGMRQRRNGTGRNRREGGEDMYIHTDRKWKEGDREDRHRYSGRYKLPGCICMQLLRDRDRLRQRQRAGQTQIQRQRQTAGMHMHATAKRQR